jgi:hypothetical protein
VLRYSFGLFAFCTCLGTSRDLVVRWPIVLLVVLLIATVLVVIPLRWEIMGLLRARSELVLSIVWSHRHW